MNQSKRPIKRLSQLCTNQNFRALTRNPSFYRKAKRFACFSEFYVTLLFKSNKKLWERAIRRRGCGINCECGGIVRNDIFPDTLAYQALTFLLWVTRRLNFFTGSRLGAGLCFDCDFCHDKFAHDEISILLPLFSLQQHFPFWCTVSSTPSAT